MEKINYKDYNLVSLGESSSIPIILKELNLSEHRYPFDWTTHIDELNNTNIYTNYYVLKELFSYNNIDENILDYVINYYIGDALMDSKKVNEMNNIFFGHEKWYKEKDNYMENAFIKYKIQFLNLYNNIKEKKTIFFIVTRTNYIEKEDFIEINNLIKNINIENKIIFISGIDHIYFEDYNENNNNFIFKHIEYDITKYPDYDYTNFNKEIKNFLINLFNN